MFIFVYTIAKIIFIKKIAVQSHQQVSVSQLFFCKENGVPYQRGVLIFRGVPRKGVTLYMSYLLTHIMEVLISGTFEPVGL